jgi:hypothetical protein
MVSKAASSEFFMILKSELDQAYGYGFRPDQEKIAEIVDEALRLSNISEDVTQEECDFYHSLSKKVSPTLEGLEELRDKVEAVQASVIRLEQNSQEIRKQFLSLNPDEQTIYLFSDAYVEVAKTADEDSRNIGRIVEQIPDLLYTRAIASKTSPFKDLAAFAQHRKAVGLLYNTAANLGNRHTKAMQEMTVEVLYSSDPRRLNLTKAAYLLSIPAGLAIAFAGTYGAAAYSTIAWGLGTLIAGVPLIYNNL